MDLDTEAIVCATLAHGEHGAVVRLLTPGHGLFAGYVRGGRSRRLRPVLQPGNLVQAHLRARVEEQLPAATLELVRSRVAAAESRFGAAALGWVTALLAQSLPEALPYPALYVAVDELLAVLDADGSSLAAGAQLVRFERDLLAHLGFGLDLSACAATGTTEDLAYVSPRSARAVSAEAGLPYADKLLPLPAFMLDGRPAASWIEVAQGLETTAFFIDRHLLGGPARRLLAARQQLAMIVARCA